MPTAEETEIPMETLTAAKIIAVPLLLWLCSALGKRWGRFAASVFAGLPIVSGPVSLFITLEQGPDFGRSMAFNVLPGICACVWENVSYAWLCRRFSWLPAITLTLISYFAFAALLCQARLPLAAWSAIAFAAPFIGLRMLPRKSEKWHAPPAHNGAPWLQMFVGMAAMIGETEGASLLGPQWSGMLVVFPVLSGVMGMFAHIESGSEAALRVFRGTLTGLTGATLFAVTVAWCLPHFSITATYGLAALAAAVSSGLLAVTLKK